MLLNSGDTLLRISSFFILFFPQVAVLSPATETKAWAKRLIQLQVCVIYLSTALWKIQGGKWLDGSAALWAIRLPDLQRFPDLWLFHWPVPLQQLLGRAITWSTLAIEFGFPFLVWIKETRRWILWLTLGLHVGISLFMRLACFEFIMICHLVLFVTADEIDWTMGKLQRLRILLHPKGAN